MNKAMAGWNDAYNSFQKWRLWTYLAWLEIQIRYKRSVIGPWWITISMVIMVATLSIVYARLFHMEIKNYLPFLVTGLLFWNFISSTLIDSNEVFRASANFIKQMNLPYSLYLLRLLTRNLIIFAHNILIYFIIILIFQINPGWNSLLFIPGFILVLLNLAWVCFLIALISTRYRDLAQIITNLVQILFFVSPITWMPNQLARSMVVNYNPVYYILDLLRSPLLGQTPLAISWIIMTLSALLGLGFTLFYFFPKHQKRIAFWID